MTTDLIAFLGARLDEDEGIAQMMAADAGDSAYWHVDAMMQDGRVACYDPARARREVAAKRAMLAELTRWPFDYRPGCDDRIRMFVRLLGSVYSDHPDYREEWKP